MGACEASERNVLLEKSMLFSIKIVKMYRTLCDEKREYVLSKQVLRSGTSIGANAREAKRGQSKSDFLSKQILKSGTSIGANVRKSRNAQSKADFINKLNVALKEADETQYWLELLNKTDYINDELYDDLFSDCEELIRILTAITKTVKMQLVVPAKKCRINS